MTLSTLRDLDPHNSSKKAEIRGRKRALALFHEAAKRVPAYRDFLKKHGVRPTSIKTFADFTSLPLTDKQSYFSQYSLEELSVDGTLDSALYISTSSGSTGIPFFWPRGHVQDVESGHIFSNIYEHVFNSKKKPTLVVISFALGTWIAGFEFYNAAKFAADRGNKIVIVTPGIDKGEALKQIKKLAPQFEVIVIAGYPPFVKDIIDEGSSAGISWKDHNVRLLTGGEAVSEKWRAGVMQKIGKTDSFDSFVNVYGMAETGIVGHGTPLALLLKSHLSNIVRHDDSSGTQLSGLYQYYPEARFFESLPDSSLILTSNAGLPLIRYDTRDTGGLLDREAMSEYVSQHLKEQAASHRIDVKKWQLPFVYLYGRKDLSISLYALNIYVENIKYALEKSTIAKDLSGLFIMSVINDENLDQNFEITIELARGIQLNTGIASNLINEIVSSLCVVNAEYSKLLSSIGERAKPHVKIVPFGQIETIPGRKHKWVRRA